MTNDSVSHSPSRPAVVGEVLFDAFPDGSRVLGGAPFNVAWHLRGFGERPLFLSRVGDDGAGRAVLSAMAAWSMDTSGIQIDPARPTGEVRVSLNDDGPSFDILTDRAWDHLEPAPALSAMAAIVPSVLCTGTLITRRPRSRRTLDSLLATGDFPVFLDVNLRPPWTDDAPLDRLFSRASWIKMNEDELERLSPDPERRADIAGRAATLRRKTGADGVVVTRGESGAVLVRGETVRERSAGTVDPFVDSVGAGDAFSAVTVLGLLGNWSPDVILDRALTFAGEICRRRGAVPSDPSLYAELLEAWNRD